ncbi:MAG: hypothetical protein VZR77_04810, partial [Candidatus Enteromonas sp.]|nr:hypothetical protein [Candidatus Enteromonas sp.]
MEFKEHLKRYLSDEQIEDLLNAMDGETVHCLLLNTKKMSDDKFLSLFPNVKPHPFVKHAYYYDKDEYEFGKDPL